METEWPSGVARPAPEDVADSVRFLEYTIRRDAEDLKRLGYWRVAEGILSALDDLQQHPGEEQLRLAV